MIYQQDVSTSDKSNPGRFWFFLFLFTALLSLSLGMARNIDFPKIYKVESSSRFTEFTEFKENKNFSTRFFKTGGCSTVGVNGCFKYQIVSKVNCRTVYGIHTQVQREDDTKIDDITSEAFNVSKNSAFILEFPTSQVNVVGRLISLKCS